MSCRKRKTGIGGPCVQLQSLIKWKVARYSTAGKGWCRCPGSIACHEPAGAVRRRLAKGNDPAGGAERGRTRITELCRLCARWRTGQGYGHSGQAADAVFRAAAGIVIGRGDRPDALNAAFL